LLLIETGKDKAWWDALPYLEQRMYRNGLAELWQARGQVSGSGSVPLNHNSTRRTPGNESMAQIALWGARTKRVVQPNAKLPHPETPET
jgi:hypothetical protein